MSWWKEAKEANEASVKQIEQERKQKGGAMAQKKAWKDMTDEEQRADIAARLAAKGHGPKQTQNTSYQSKDSKYVQCTHDGSKLAFTMYDNTLRFAGAKGTLLKEAPSDTKLIIDLADMVKLNTVPWIRPGALHEKLQHLKIEPPPAPPILSLNWPDRSEPRCKIDWWGKLVETLRQDFSGGRIIIACIGSHGRTGTAMASILLAASPKLSVEDAIKFVRKTHCHKAVESWDQIEYLQQFRPDEQSEWLDKYAASDSVSTGYGYAGYNH